MTEEKRLQRAFIDQREDLLIVSTQPARGSHERASLVITAVAFGLVVLGCFGWVRGTPLSEALLVRTAVSTSLGILVATLLAVLVTRRVVGSVVAPRVLLRVGLGFGLALVRHRRRHERDQARHGGVGGDRRDGDPAAHAHSCDVDA